MDPDRVALPLRGRDLIRTEHARHRLGRGASDQRMLPPVPRRRDCRRPHLPRVRVPDPCPLPGNRGPSPWSRGDVLEGPAAPGDMRLRRSLAELDGRVRGLLDPGLALPELNLSL